jgi:hypothetical protein
VKGFFSPGDFDDLIDLPFGLFVGLEVFEAANKALAFGL